MIESNRNKEEEINFVSFIYYKKNRKPTIRTYKNFEPCLNYLFKNCRDNSIKEITKEKRENVQDKKRYFIGILKKAQIPFRNAAFKNGEKCKAIVEEEGLTETLNVEILSTFKLGQIIIYHVFCSDRRQVYDVRENNIIK